MAYLVLKYMEKEYDSEESEVITIGRGLDNRIRFDDLRVSERHCEITWNPDVGATIKDFGSTNGTYIQRDNNWFLVGRRLDSVNREHAKDFISKPFPLISGDKIRLHSECLIDVEYTINSTQKENGFIVDGADLEREGKTKEAYKIREAHKAEDVCRVVELSPEERGETKIPAPTKDINATEDGKVIETMREDSFDGYVSQDGDALSQQFRQNYNMERLCFNGSTVLWKATPSTWSNNAKRVVIKILTLDKDAFRDSEQLVNAELLFEREKTIARQLDHPNIIKTYEVGKFGNQLYIIMEYCKHDNLADFVTDKKLQIMPEKMAIRIIIQMLKGLNYYHNLPNPIEYDDVYRRSHKSSEPKLVHRDIKPANVLVRSIDSDGNPEIVISDFGIAKDTSMGGSTGITTASTVRATLEFAPCEQIQTPALVNQGVDIWSTFAVLFWLLTGETPRDMRGCQFNRIKDSRQLERVKKYFRDNPVRKIRSFRKDVSGDLAELIDGILCEDQSVHEYSNEEELALIDKLEKML